MPDPNIKVLYKKTYLKLIENSIGSKLFNSLFVEHKDSGKVEDVLKDGEFSCAFFVSSILTLAQVLDRPHSTVSTLNKLFSESDSWQEINISDVDPGDVVFYKKAKFEDGSENAHIGFALNKKEAVSTDYKIKSVVKHQIDNRAVDVIYRYSWGDK